MQAVNFHYTRLVDQDIQGEASSQRAVAGADDVVRVHLGGKTEEEKDVQLATASEVSASVPAKPEELVKQLFAAFLDPKIEALNTHRAKEMAILRQARGYRITGLGKILSELNLDDKGLMTDRKQIDQAVLICHLTDQLRKKLHIDKPAPLYVETFALWHNYKAEIATLAQTFRAKEASWMDENRSYAYALKRYADAFDETESGCIIS